jgi:hypothetical protein
MSAGFAGSSSASSLVAARWRMWTHTTIITRRSSGHDIRQGMDLLRRYGLDSVLTQTPAGRMVSEADGLTL